MVLLKLGLVQRKVLLFINSINEGYRLRLFLEAFGIKSAVLNAELPLNSRHHILQVSVAQLLSIMGWGRGRVRGGGRGVCGAAGGSSAQAVLFCCCYSTVLTQFSRGKGALNQENPVDYQCISEGTALYSK